MSKTFEQYLLKLLKCVQDIGLRSEELGKICKSQKAFSTNPSTVNYKIQNRKTLFSDNFIKSWSQSGWKFEALQCGVENEI